MPTEKEIMEEAVKIYTEDEDSLMEHIDSLLQTALEDFNEEENIQDQAAQDAAKIMHACITEGTRTGHIRIIKAYISYHLRLNTSWQPKTVTTRTPGDICQFILKKCGSKDDGYGGNKFSTAISTRAALTYWYRLARPHESTSEWRYDPNTDMCYGLPTRSRQVAEFMTGLEKTKARAGETSNSARALTIHDMHSLYDQCLPPSATGPAVLRQGIVRYAAYLLAWLLMLRIDEAVSLEFESINMLLTVRDWFEVRLKTRKQAQTGVGHSWKLFANDDNPKICPVRALICLARLYNGEKINESGPLFLKVDGNGAVHQNSPMTSSMLSRALATDLQNIGNKSWALYGTHSFHRGGCQHCIKDSKWTIDMVAAWGGWSQVEAVTMFRYFYSPNDNHEFMAEYDRNEPKRQHVGQKELKG